MSTSSLVRAGVLVQGRRRLAPQNVPLYVMGLTQESSVPEYQAWCTKFKDQVEILSLNDVYESMSQVMQKKFVEMFPSVPMTELPPHNVWVEMAKICGGTLMWYKIMFHSLECHMNNMQDNFKWKPIVFVVPSIFATKFKECIKKLYFNHNVKIFYPGSFPTQEDIDNEMPFGLDSGQNFSTNRDITFENTFQEIFAPLLVKQIEDNKF